jgi:hypothetical protein
MRYDEYMFTRYHNLVFIFFVLVLIALAAYLFFGSRTI